MNNTATDYETLLVDIKGAVARVTLNRPDAANGINLQMAKDLYNVSLAFDNNPAIRAVIITGSGKMFCAGGDLKSFASEGDKVSQFLKEITFYLHGAISRLAHMNAPVIIAVNGTAAGAGFSLAVLGDYVLAAESAKFTMAYTAAGLSPDGSSSYFLPRLIGVRKTQELMLTNRLLTAQEALDWGLLNKVVASEELLDAAETVATQLAAGPTQAFGSVKKLLLASFENNLEGQMELESVAIANMAATADGKEGIAAFIDKRKPAFSGQ